MTNTRKSIVLGIEGDNSAARAIFGLERCGYAVSVWSYLEAQLSKVFGDVVVCLELLETELRIVVDLTRWSVSQLQYSNI